MFRNSSMYTTILRVLTTKGKTLALENFPVKLLNNFPKKTVAYKNVCKTICMQCMIRVCTHFSNEICVM